jgi:hypothetical protein
MFHEQSANAFATRTIAREKLKLYLILSVGKSS